MAWCVTFAFDTPIRQVIAQVDSSLTTSVIIIKTELNAVVRENWAVLAWPYVCTSDDRDQSINLTSFQDRIGADFVGVPSVWVQASCISLSCSLNLSWIGPPVFSM